MEVSEVIEGIRKMGPFAVEYSGGLDSTVLAALAVRAFGENTMAIIAVTPMLSPEELTIARENARRIGIRLVEVEYSEFDNSDFASNGPDRCRICRMMRGQRVLKVATENDFSRVADGVNIDDLGDYRPGIGAADELGYLHPFVELGLGKEDIRTLARALGLDIQTIPSGACLASRISHFEPITREKIDMVARAEEYLHTLGLKYVRVRYHNTSLGPLARIELPRPQEIYSMDVDKIRKELRDIGFYFITLDLDGYRPAGSHMRE